MGMSDKRLWFAGAFLWGFAEATFFFIVPDVLLTAGVLIFGFAVALRFCVTAALGAVAGGMVMFWWGAMDPASARHFVSAVPLIGDDLMARVSAEIAGAWPVNLTMGAISGAPYKIYAVEAGAAGVEPTLFSMVSMVARGLRFFLAISITAGAFVIAQRMGLPSWRGPGLALAWAALYAAYIAYRLSIS